MASRAPRSPEACGTSRRLSPSQKRIVAAASGGANHTVASRPGPLDGLERARRQDAVEPERVPLTDLGGEPGLDAQAGRSRKTATCGTHQEARAADPRGSAAAASSMWG